MDSAKGAMKNSINKKLAAGFGLCLLLIVTLVAFNYFALLELEQLYQATQKRSGHLELAMHSQHIGKEMYQVIADAVINRELTKSDRAWLVCKSEGLEMLSNVEKTVETPEEGAYVREAKQAITDIIRIYEQEMLPLIRKGATVPGRLSAVDAQLDKSIEAIDQALQRVAHSMSKKNQRADWDYNVVLKRTHVFGLMISLAGVLAVIFIISLATRQIVGPLSEITGAALEIKKGNFLVGLKHTSTDEIGVLSEAFRDMSQQVEKRTLELQDSNALLQKEICERRQAEQALQEARDGLEQRVTERTHELSDTNIMLKQEITQRERLEQQLLEAKKLESIGQIAGGVAHEVRNPLNAILTITEALFREKEIDGNPDFLPYIRHIRTQVTRLANLMNDLLDLGKTIPASSLQSVPLFEFCCETITLWRSSGSAPNKQIVLVCNDPPDHLSIRADSMKLQQVFFNLMENASQHSPPDGSVCFSILEADVSENGRGMAVVHISDQGCGISPDKFSRIFDPFYSERKGGTGLGLALVKHYIESMEGTVRIWNNAPLPGCTAEIRIPLVRKEHA